MDTRNRNHALKKFENHVLCGDGRNDSPGHKAKFLLYVLMEQFTHLIVILQTIDCRETKGVSVNMERLAVEKILTKMKDILKISEFVSDASTSIMKSVRELRTQYPE